RSARTAGQHSKRSRGSSGQPGGTGGRGAGRDSGEGGAAAEDGSHPGGGGAVTPPDSGTKRAHSPGGVQVVVQGCGELRDQVAGRPHRRAPRGSPLPRSEMPIGARPPPTSGGPAPAATTEQLRQAGRQTRGIRQALPAKGPVRPVAV